MKKRLSKIALAFAALFTVCLPITAHAYTTANRTPHLHIFEGFSTKDLIRLEDGSEWRAATPNEAFIAYSWQPTVRDLYGVIQKLGDRITITPNKGIFTSSSYYPFYLNNQNDGSYIRVEPVASPIHFGANSFWVFNKNMNLGYVYLASGGSEDLIPWEISSSYYHLLKDWEPNDHIVVGVYDSFISFLSSYNYILINFNKAHFVQARPH
ncbi:MAG: hypothetical protein V4494_02885 [Chlamydiota bacterium]